MLRKCYEVDKEFFQKDSVLNNHIFLFQKVKSTFDPLDNILILKAPGRVNLIGEHTDYNMGPVLPCAINKEIVFCIRPGKTSEIKAINVNDKFDIFNFSIQSDITPYSKGHWGNYIKAGVKGILDYLKLSAANTGKELKGFDVVVSSTLPHAAGLSSSSALVVASALSLSEVNNLDLSKQKIAEICAKAEHFVGTAGGGMDQAASLLGKENSFLNMEFNPLKVEQIIAPEGIQLVLFNSMIQAEKSGKSRAEYNRRVLECKMGVDLFNRFFVKTFDGNYRKVDYIGQIKPETFNTTQNELDKWVKAFLDSLQNVYSSIEFAEKMSLAEQDLNKQYQSVLKGGDQFREPFDGFKIKSRFKHVYSECRRVNNTVDCLKNNSLNELGNLINQSHDSLSQDYEVSTAEVDDLVRILRENGAYGARIIGAGFGGMVLALTDISKMNNLIEQTKKTYYFDKIYEKNNDYIFPCVPADGAGLL